MTSTFLLILEHAVQAMLIRLEEKWLILHLKLKLVAPNGEVAPSRKTIQTNECH